MKAFTACLFLLVAGASFGQMSEAEKKMFREAEQRGLERRRIQTAPVSAPAPSDFSKESYTPRATIYTDPNTNQRYLQADQARNQSRWQQENKSSSQVVAPQLLEVSPDALKKVSDACFGMLRSSFFDPYSVVREGARMFRMQDGATVVVLALNAKNRMGAYVGIKQYFCSKSVNDEMTAGVWDLPY